MSTELPAISAQPRGLDLKSRADVVLLVETFYRHAFADPLLGRIFTEVAQMDLAKHLPIMADFWETVLFRAGKYSRNALAVHFALNAKEPLTDAHFERWLQLWCATVDQQFHGPKAELAKIQATRIAGSIHRRVQGQSASEFVTIERRPV